MFREISFYFLLFVYTVKVNSHPYCLVTDILLCFAEQRKSYRFCKWWQNCNSLV